MCACALQNAYNAMKKLVLFPIREVDLLTGGVDGYSHGVMNEPYFVLDMIMGGVRLM